MWFDEYAYPIINPNVENRFNKPCNVPIGQNKACLVCQGCVSDIMRHARQSSIPIVIDGVCVFCIIKHASYLNCYSLNQKHMD